MSRRALVTGAAGQDGSYLCEHLVRNGYETYGLVRRSTRDFAPIPAVRYLTGDMLDGSSIMAALEESDPGEVYNLAADTFVGTSWQQPVEQAEVTGLGALRLLECVRWFNTDIKVYQASTSELYSGEDAPQNELTPFHPRSPYASAKLFAHSTAVNYRESYGMFICCGILFNHESPRRGRDFVTQKIATQVAEIVKGKREGITLGNLDTKRDWGYAPEYVEAMHIMMQRAKPDDYVVATGETHSIGEFLDATLKAAGRSGPVSVVVDEAALRPADVAELRGDPSKVNGIGWRAVTKYEKLAEIMFKAAMERIG